MAKITSGAFIELADLLVENIRAQEAEPHSYLDGKLLVNYQHLTRLPYSIPQPHQTSHPSIPSTPLSIVDRGMMVPVAGPWVNVGTVMFVNDVMVNTP